MFANADDEVVPTSALLGPIESDAEDAAEEFEPDAEGDNDHEIDDSEEDSNVEGKTVLVLDHSFLSHEQYLSLCDLFLSPDDDDDDDDEDAPPTKKLKTEE